MDIFYILFLLGEGEGGVRRAGMGGVSILNLKIPRRGASRRGRGRGAGRVSAANWVGGGHIFFSGPKCLQTLALRLLNALNSEDIGV